MMTRAHLLLLSFIVGCTAHQYSIDMSRCDQDMKCFGRESCDPTPGKANDKIADLTSQVQTCDAIIQIKSFTDKKWFIMVEVDASTNTKDISDAGISFKQGSTPVVQFACLKDKVETKNANFKIEKKETRYENKKLFCAFTFESADGTTAISKHAGSDDFLTLEFTTDQLYSLTSLMDADSFWRAGSIQKNCDVDEGSSTEHVDSTYIYHSLDFIQKAPITCDPAHLFQIHIDGESEPKLFAKNEGLGCNYGWTYGSPPKKTKYKFKAHCVEKFCSLCSPLEDLTCAGCTPSTQAEKDDCKTATCDKPWLLEGGKVVKGELECKQETGDNKSKNFGWYAKDGSVAEKVTKAACLDIGICWSSSKIVETCTKDGITLGFDCVDGKLMKSEGNTQLTCPAGMQMTYLTAGSSTNAAKLTCDFKTGKFVDENAIEVAAGSSVLCLKQTETASEAPQTGSTPVFEIIGGIIAFIVVAGICVAGYFLFKKFFNKKKGDKNEKSKKRSKNHSASSGSSNEMLLKKSKKEKKDGDKKDGDKKDGDKKDGDKKEDEKKGEEKKEEAKKDGDKKEDEKKGEEKKEEAKKDDKVEKQPDAKPEAPPSQPPSNPPAANAQAVIARWKDAKMPEITEMELEPDYWKTFNEKEFMAKVFPKFSSYPFDSRLLMVQKAGSLGAYARRPAGSRNDNQVENKSGFTLQTFFRVLKQIHDERHNRVEIWERLFRFVRMFHFRMTVRIPNQNNTNYCSRLKAIMVGIARPMLEEFTWKRADKERQSETKLRCFAIRVLLWAGEKDVIDQVKALAATPFEEVETPLRAIALGYAVKHEKRFAEIKAKYWQTVLDNPKDPETDKFGTKRQHILYALAMTEVNEELTGVLCVLYDLSNLETSFTSFDCCWAYYGACEYTETARNAIDFHAKHGKVKAISRDLIRAQYYKHLELAKKQNSNVNADNFVKQWTRALVDYNDALAECCFEHEIFLKISSAAIHYEDAVQVEFVANEFNKVDYEDRIRNMESFFVRLSPTSPVIDDALKICE